MMSEELKPCPFCGSRAYVVHASHIRCQNIYNCDAETRLGAIAWNRRTHDFKQGLLRAAEICEEIISGRRNDGMTTGYNAIMDVKDAIRAAAEKS